MAIYCPKCHEMIDVTECLRMPPKDRFANQCSKCGRRFYFKQHYLYPNLRVWQSHYTSKKYYKQR